MPILRPTLGPGCAPRPSDRPCEPHAVWPAAPRPPSRPPESGHAAPPTFLSVREFAPRVANCTSRRPRQAALPRAPEKPSASSHFSRRNASVIVGEPMVVVAHNLAVPLQHVVLDRSQAFGVGFDVLVVQIVRVPRDQQERAAFLKLGRTP